MKCERKKIDGRECKGNGKIGKGKNGKLRVGMYYGYHICQECYKTMKAIHYMKYKIKKEEV